MLDRVLEVAAGGRGGAVGVARDPARAAEAARSHLERTVEHVASRLAEQPA